MRALAAALLRQGERAPDLLRRLAFLAESENESTRDHVIARLIEVFQGVEAPPIAAERDHDPLVRARARGLELKRAIFDSPDMLTANEVARWLGVSRARVSQMRAEGKLLALAHPTNRRNLRYPAWQLEEPILGALPRLLDVLEGLDGWEIWLFFTGAEPLLNGRTPLETLRGEADPSRGSWVIRGRRGALATEAQVEKAARRFRVGEP